MTVFAYRSPYAGPLSKHLRRLPDPSGLDWFRRGWDDARDDPEAWVERELGTHVYGLCSIFEAAAKHDLAKPATWRELRTLLETHLYVEGEVRVAEGSVRVLTDDDELSLAYHFLDDEVIRARPDRLAYHVHAEWPLPTAASDHGTAPCTTVVLSTVDMDSDWETEHHLVRFDGVRVPDFGRYLRAADVDDSWPAELVVLRALVGEDDGLTGALLRLNHWTAYEHQSLDTSGLRGDHALARLAASGAVSAEGATEGPFDARRPDLSRIETADHLVQAALHMSDWAGYRQLFIFDDLWSAAQPDLSSSLVRYATNWDPLDDWWAPGPSSGR